MSDENKNVETWIFGILASGLIGGVLSIFGINWFFGAVCAFFVFAFVQFVKPIESAAETKGGKVNPLQWKREHQVALIVISIVGALTGTCVGYAIFTFHHSDYYAGASLSLWFSSGYLLWWTWPLFGAAIAGLSFYAIRLLKLTK